MQTLASSKLAPKSAAARPAARRSVVVRAEGTGLAPVERNKGQLFLGGVTDKAALSYLTGALPGDKGFDPLGMLDPSVTNGEGGLVTPRWLTYAEVIHCRWAMLGAAGCLAPEVLGALHVIPEATALPWFASGVFPPAGTFTYWSDAQTLFWGQLVLMGFAEHKRLWDYYTPGSQAEQPFFGQVITMEKTLFAGNKEAPQYPGGPWFNFLNLGSKSEAEMKNLKSKEIENGRVAMIACLGYGIQAAMTGASPIANLAAHLADPVNNNILTTFSKVGGAF